jgi:hypothetical protein
MSDQRSSSPVACEPDRGRHDSRIPLRPVQQPLPDQVTFLYREHAYRSTSATVDA